MTKQISTPRSLPLTALLALALAAPTLMGCNDESTGMAREELVRPVKMAVAARAGSARFKSFPGITEAAIKSTLAFRVSGLVQQVPVKAGQRLKKNDLIARMDETPYRNVVAEREAKFQLAEAQFDRQKVLYGKKLVAKSKLDEVSAILKATKAGLDIAREDLKYTSLKAPYDGVIAKVHIDNHQNVKDNDPIAEIHGVKNIDIVFFVPEHILLRAKRKEADKTPFTVRFNTAQDHVFTAHYRKHDSVPDTATRSYRVVLAMPMPDDLLVLPGMSVTVEADMSGLESGISDTDVLIPIEALFEKAGKTYVWGVDDSNVSHRLAVTPGLIEGSSVRISKGLKSGQRLVAAGVSHIYEGLKVRELKKERGL